MVRFFRKGIEIVGTTRVEHTIEINRPVEEVFAFLEKPENMPLWANSVVEATQTSSGPVAQGTTCHIVNRAMGRRMDMNFVVTEYERNSIYASKTTSGPFPMQMRYTVETVDGGTKLNVVSEVDLSGFMGLAGPIVKRMAQKQVEGDHANLKALLESKS